MKRDDALSARAADSVRALVLEFRDDMGGERGWIAEASRCLGLSYTTTWGLAHGRLERCGFVVIEQVLRKTRMPLEALLES